MRKNHGGYNRLIARRKKMPDEEIPQCKMCALRHFSWLIYGNLPPACATADIHAA
jgi:hypothetical protein